MAKLATQGYADKLHHEGFQPLNELMQSFVANGGEIWARGACAKPGGIQESSLVKGARIASAANVVELLASGAGSMGF